MMEEMAEIEGIQQLDIAMLKLHGIQVVQK